jgi:hypothetical protein
LLCSTIVSIHARATTGASAHRDPCKAGRLAAAQALSRFSAGSAGTLLLFASGPHGAAARLIAWGAREVAPDATIAVVGTPRISSADDPEVCLGGVAAIALPMKSEVSVTRGDYTAPSMAALGRSIGDERARQVLLFGRSRPGVRVALDAFVTESNAADLTGALGVGAALAAARPGDEPEEGGMLALRLGVGTGVVRTSVSSVRALVPFEFVTAVRRGYVERVGDRRALDWLRESGRGAPEGGLLLALLEGKEGDPSSVLVRGVAGIEPSRGAIHVGEDVVAGERIAIGVSTGRVTPEAVESACRRATRALRGAAPHAAILVDPVGRSTRAALAETRELATRFGEMPWIGIRGAAQIVSARGRPRVAQHMATLSIVCSAS